MNQDDDEFEMEESAPVRFEVSPESVMSPRISADKPGHPKAVDVDDMDEGWSSGFNEQLFDEDEPEEKEEQVDEDDMPHFEVVPGDEKEEQREGGDDDDHESEQDHAASEIHVSIPLIEKRIRA